MIDIKVGDKVKANKVEKYFGKYVSKDDVFIVNSINDDWVTLNPVDDKKNENPYALITKQYGVSHKVFNECFDKYEDPKPKNNLETKVPVSRINWIMDNSEFEVSTIFDTCTLVTCKLPNGFVLVERSACVDPDNYSETIGEEICRKKIKDKIWELEGYMLQDKVYNANLNDDSIKYCEDNCCNCYGSTAAANWLI